MDEPVNGTERPLYGLEVLGHFPVELHSVVQRHGPDMVGYCCTLLGMNSALEFLAHRLQQHTDLFTALQHISRGCQDLSNNLTNKMGWEGTALTECVQDVARAKLLAQPSSSGKIIVPN